MLVPDPYLELALVVDGVLSGLSFLCSQGTAAQHALHMLSKATPPLQQLRPFQALPAVAALLPL